MNSSLKGSRAAKQVILPNFLIVGAPKCGTTSLYHYLNQHPEVHMSPIKEPKFITSHFIRYPSSGIGDARIQENVVKSYEDYCRLFSASPGVKALGEASADTLYYYNNAIQWIKKLIGNPRIIIILRNPVDRSYSAYMSLLREQREFLPFEEALEQEDIRKNNNWEYIWYYKDVGLYFNQVKAYMEHFDRVNVYLYDDLKNNTLGLMKNLHEFLEVDSSFVPDINLQYNISGVPKNMFLHKLLTEANVLKSVLKPFLRMIMNDKMMERTIENLKIRNLKRPHMKHVVRRDMENFFREDILRLQELINRDLSNWLIETIM
jgi:hypothetical protein